MKTATITTKEFAEMQDFFLKGGILENDFVGYQILIREDGSRIFYINEGYKFFKNQDAFIRAAIRTIKRGY